MQISTHPGFRLKRKIGTRIDYAGIVRRTTFYIVIDRETIKTIKLLRNIYILIRTKTKIPIALTIAYVITKYIFKNYFLYVIFVL